jgi:hypothetical protein
LVAFVDFFVVAFVDVDGVVLLLLSFPFALLLSLSLAFGFLCKRWCCQSVRDDMMEALIQISL